LFKIDNQAATVFFDCGANLRPIRDADQLQSFALRDVRRVPEFGSVGEQLFA
jgi:hypothetical protein